MKTYFTQTPYFAQTALVVAAMLTCLGNVQAEELVVSGIRFSELESRLATIESQLTGQDGLQQASYCCDNGCCDGSCCETSFSDVSCCGDYCDCCSPCGCDSGFYAEVQFNFFRAHVSEGAIVNGSKLSEEYELSPRFIVGYEDCNGLGGRVRYWHHGHHHNNLNGPGGIRFEWDVIDLEATKHLTLGCRTDVTLSGGFRGADINIVYGNWDAHTYAIGLTSAVDVRTVICCTCNSEWASVYGARLAILGGDISGGAQGTERDQNWRVWEIYAGVEQRVNRCGIELYHRMAFEMQNWHADSMTGEQSPTPANDTSIGFVGPSWTMGIDF